MDAQTLLEQLKADRNAAIARQRKCRKNIKSAEEAGDPKMVLHWEQEYDRAWFESSELKRTIDIIEKKLA